MLREKDAVEPVILDAAQEMNDLIVNFLTQGSVVISSGEEIRPRDPFGITDTHE
jgi:hypothetical protein